MRDKRETFLVDTRMGADGVMELMLRTLPRIDRMQEKNADLTADGVLPDGRWILTLTDDEDPHEKTEITGTVTDGTVVFSTPNVRLWDPEHPYLYHAAVTLIPAAGRESRTLYEGRVGFRYLAREGRRVYWNGVPLKLKGICYREHAGDLAGAKRDLALFAQANINFLRSLRAPFSDELLALCDEMGFLVEDTASFYEVGGEREAIQDLPHEEVYFLSETQKMLRLGSHVSILIWSLGSDCAWGTNFRSAGTYVRRADPVRLLSFHLPMSIPEEEEQMDVWPVHYIDYRQPFDVCFDQMVIFHTPGTDGGIGYGTGQADYELPVLHEIWSPVCCHNRDEIRRDPQIRSFWGESIRRFAQKSRHTDGCLGGAVLAGVDEDGSLAELTDYDWGILDKTHAPKPEYEQLQAAYAPVRLRVLPTEDGVLTEDGGMTLEIENRFLFTDLSECRLLLCGKELPAVPLAGAPGGIYRFRIPAAALLESEKERRNLFEERSGEPIRPVPQLTDAARPLLSVASADGMRIYARISTGEGAGTAAGRLSRCGAREGTAKIPPEDAAEQYTKSAVPSGLHIDETDKDDLIVESERFVYRFSRKTCLLVYAGGRDRQILAGGPYLTSTGLLHGTWQGRSLRAVYADAGKVRITISGGYRDAYDLTFYLTIHANGRLTGAYEVNHLYRHMPHTVKAGIGISPGGLNEKGISYLLAPGTFRYPDFPDTDITRTGFAVTDETGRGIRVLSDIAKVRCERVPDPHALIDDTDPRMRFRGSWQRMYDYCGDINDTEMLSGTAGDEMELAFRGSGIWLIGSVDINYGQCDIYLDGKQVAAGRSQFPEQVDIRGMSRGYEKRYGQVLYKSDMLAEGDHIIRVVVRGEAERGAQNCYTSIDCAVLAGKDYPVRTLVHMDSDYNYIRMVRGCYMRPKVELIPGERESFTIQLL